MCLAQGPQRSDAGEARTRGLSVSSQALYHWATALPSSRLWCLTVSLFLSNWYPGSGVVLDCIDFLSLPSFSLWISQSQILLDSLRWGSVYFGEKKLNCKKHHFQELCFSKVSNVRNTSASFGKPHLSLILTNQCLTIMVRSGTVINIVLLWWHCPYADPEGDRGSRHPTGK